jgi:hypothetical protein
MVLRRRRLQAALAEIKRLQAVKKNSASDSKISAAEPALNRRVIPSNIPQILIPFRQRKLSDPHERKQRSGWWSNVNHYGPLEQFKTMISNPGSDRETFLVALDTEFTERGVTEVGITTLRVRDILDVDSGKHLAGWMPKLKHYHVRCAFFTVVLQPRG